MTQLRALSDSLCDCFRKWRNETVIVQVLCFGSIRKWPHARLHTRDSMRGQRSARSSITPLVVHSNLHQAGENIRQGAKNSHMPSHLPTHKPSPLGRATNDSPRATTLAPPRRTIIAKISKAPPSPIRPRAGPYYIPPFPDYFLSLPASGSPTK